MRIPPNGGNFYVKSRKKIKPNGNKIQITVSIGVASYPETAQNPEQLYQQADEWLYVAKRAGRNQVFMYRTMEMAK